MSEKIVLIDGHSILNRAFYGLPDLTNAKGWHTNAVYGFLNIMFKIIDEEKPDYLTVAFDLKAPTFRHKMYDAYKGTRKPAPEEFREQVPRIKEVLKSMGVSIVQLEGYEADDILGTLAVRSEARGIEVSLVSGDRDLLQLATDHIKIRIPKTRGGQTTVEDYYTKDVIEHYQVSPPQIVELKALMGDTSDNIPGLPGVGEKTATKLIVEYGSVENAHAHVDEIKPNKAKLAMEEHYDLAVLSKKLAKIDTEAPVKYSWEDSRMSDLYTPEAYELFCDLEFKNLLKRFDVAAKPEADKEKHFTEISDLDAVEALFERFAHKDVVGVSVTDEDKVVTAVTVSDGEETCRIRIEGFITADYVAEHLKNLQKDTLICAFDTKKILRRNLIANTHFYDCSIAAYLLNPLKSSYDVWDMAKEFLDEVIPETSEWRDAYEAFAVMRSKEVLENELKRQGMDELYRMVELPLVVTLAQMEGRGVKVDRKELDQYGANLTGRISELESLIYEMAGETFNINSPKQLGVILFEKLGLPGGKKTKTGFSTAADVLEKLAPDHEIISNILEYRTLTKLKSTYADGLASCIEDDGRIRTTFNQTITATGRLSSTEPNLQNIPMRMELGRLIRKCFIPENGYVLVDADYSQIELRVLAHMSGDEALIKAYREAKDIHRITASQVFHVSFDEVTPLQRRNAKAVNFGIVYGISSFGLSQDLSISRKEAQQYIEDYFATYPKIKAFLDGLVDFAKQHGYAKTMFGRRRPVPELSSSNFMQRSFGERVAMNSPIQGTAADIIKIAMNRVNERLQEEKLKSRLILQVHDELLVEAWQSECEQVKQILRHEMMHAADLAVPMEIDMHDGKDWYDAH